MAMIKPRKPECFEGQRNEFAVKAWLHQVRQYIALVQVGNPLQLDDQTKISLAATYFSGNAATWWYTVIASNQTPETWEEFEGKLVQEFIPVDSVRRSRDKLRRLVQRYSVSAYLSEFRNLVLTIPNMHEGEMVDRFCQGLKPQIRLEVMKAGASTMEEAARISLNVDSALFGSGIFTPRWQSNPGAPTPMEIGNIQQLSEEEQRDLDRRSNACFTCHKVGCRPWKHKNYGKGQRRNRVKFNNANIDSGAESAGSSSEN